MEPRAVTAPPRLAEWLLVTALPGVDGDAIAGDLYEEFHTRIVPARGATRARAWYIWQVARSLMPLFFRSWQRASLLRASVAVMGAGVAATLPAMALVSLRAFVLSQVPLKTTAELSATFALVLTLVVLCSVGWAAVLTVQLLTRSAPPRR